MSDRGHGHLRALRGCVSPSSSTTTFSHGGKRSLFRGPDLASDRTTFPRWQNPRPGRVRRVLARPKGIRTPREAISPPSKRPAPSPSGIASRPRSGPGGLRIGNGDRSFSTGPKTGQSADVAGGDDTSGLRVRTADPSEEQTHDRLGRPGERDVRIRRLTGNQVNLTTSRDEGHRLLIVTPQFDGEVSSLRIDALEPGDDHVVEPVGPEVVGPPRSGHERSGPPPQGVDHLVEILAPGRQPVAPIVEPLDHALPFETAETFDQQIGGDPGQPGEELVVSAGSPEQLPDDQERPSLTDDIERSGEAAVLPVRPHPGILT